jgi:hypothetical protein
MNKISPLIAIKNDQLERHSHRYSQKLIIVQRLLRRLTENSTQSQVVPSRRNLLILDLI